MIWSKLFEPFICQIVQGRSEKDKVSILSVEPPPFAEGDKPPNMVIGILFREPFKGGKLDIDPRQNTRKLILRVGHGFWRQTGEIFRC